MPSSSINGDNFLKQLGYLRIIKHSQGTVTTSMFYDWATSTIYAGGWQSWVQWNISGTLLNLILLKSSGYKKCVYNYANTKV